MNTQEKGFFSQWHRLLGRKNPRDVAPLKIRNHDFPNTGQGLSPLSYSCRAIPFTRFIYVLHADRIISVLIQNWAPYLTFTASIMLMIFPLCKFGDIFSIRDDYQWSGWPSKPSSIVSILHKVTCKYFELSLSKLYDEAENCCCCCSFSEPVVTFTPFIPTPRYAWMLFHSNFSSWVRNCVSYYSNINLCQNVCKVL